MKTKKYFKIIFYLAALLILNTSVYSQNPDSVEIVQNYEMFEQTVQSNDKTAHRALYLQGSMPLNIIGKAPNGPKLILLNSNNWLNTWANDLELRISDIDVSLIDNIAYTTAHFQEYNGTRYLSYGTDVFVYVRTSDGWRFSTLNNTFVRSNDMNDYSIPVPLPNTIESVLDSLKTTIGNKDKTSFLSLFVSDSRHYFSFQNTFDEVWSSNAHSALGFIDSLVNSQSSFELVLENSEILIHDQYIATVVSDYTFLVNGAEIESGKQLLTLTADVNNGWRISSAVNSNSGATGIDTEENLQTDFVLEQNYPNPFNPSTSISFNIPERAFVSLKVFDLLGNEVMTVLNGIKSPGNHSVKIEGNNLASGIYFYTLRAGSLIDSKKMILLK